MWPFNKSAPGGNPLADHLDMHDLKQEVSALRGELSQVKNESTVYPFSSAEKWTEFFGGGQKFAGEYVDQDTAMRVSAVFGCVRLISTAVSCAPVKIYTRQGDLRTRNDGHQLSAMLRLRPNRFMVAATFWKAFMQDKLLMGNGYAVIERTKWGQPLALIPVKAKNATVHYAWELGWDTTFGVEKNRLFYEFRFDDGNWKIYDQSDVIHVPNVGWNGKYGISTVRAMAQAVGLSLGAEKSSAEFFVNGMQSALAISLKGDPSPDAMARFVQHLQDKYSGSGNHHKPLVMPNDGTATTLSMSAADTQLLESRKFEVIDICRFFGVHPVMIGENEKTSSFGGGIEQMGRWFNTLTLNEHFTAIEQELEVKLFSPENNFAEFDESDITRGDTQARAEYFKSALGSLQQPGWLSINEVRAAEGHAPKDNCDDINKPESVAPSQQPPAEGGKQ